MEKYALMAAAFGALAITAASGLLIIPALRRLHFGQTIKEIGPTWHQGKNGTPTMGGIMFILGAGVTVFILGWSFMLEGVFWHLYVYLFALIFGLIGFVDDYRKVRQHQNEGLTARQKFILQLAAAVVFLVLMRYEGLLTNDLYIPFLNMSFTINWIVYLIFAAFVIVGCVNAVNLTDGIDGLAASVTLPVAIFFVFVGFRRGDMGVVIFSAALAGALLGFLRYNFNPAKVFMGDTGSLFLGGAVAGLAFACEMPLILLLVGLIYIIETLSVILQVTYFKATHGKRLFKMAPIHHHYELKGWPEPRVIVRFWIISLMLVLIGLATLKVR